MRFLLLPLLLCTILRADTLGDLRATLGHFAGKDTIQARISLQERHDEPVPPTTTPTEAATAFVEAGPDGLRITWSADQLRAALPANNETQTKPYHTRREIDALTVFRISDSLNGAPAFLAQLENATVLEDKPAVHDGKAVRLLSLKLQPKLDAKARKFIRDSEFTGTIRLAPDGTPLAATAKARVKGRVLLLINFESVETTEYEFARVGDRLVITRQSKKSKSTGGGETHTNTSETRVTLAAAG